MSTPQSKSAAFVAFILGVVVSAALGDPRPIIGLVGESSLTPQQRDQIRTYAEFYCNQLATGDVPVVERAKRQLLDPMRAPRVTGDFRSEYSKVLTPCLAGVIDGDNPHAAVNAMQLLGFLGMPAALDVLKDHIDSKDEECFEIRLWAAKAFRMAAEAGRLKADDVNPLLRQLGAACRSETDPPVLRRQFEAIASVDSSIARDVLLSAVGKKLDELQGQTEPSRLMEAIYPALVRLRDQYLNPTLTAADQKVFGKDVAHLLCKVFEVGLAHWDKIQSDEQTRTEIGRSYRGAIRVAESFLKTIDRTVRAAEPPRTQLGAAWENVDKSRFEAGHQDWRDILTSPPYNRR
ncbi:MAG: hypothetical protein V3T84_03445 [Phycisphaerales bacterium]